MSLAVPNNGGAQASEEGRVAELTVISYKKLFNNDAIESQRLLTACTDWGFFYLDLGGSEDQDYLDMVDQLFCVGKEYFAKPREEKLNDTREDMSTFNICGYKPSGLDYGTVENKKDGCEGLRIPADLVFSPASNTQLRWPDGIKDHSSLFERFIRESYPKANIILQRLSDTMNLEGEDRFEAHHRSNFLSTTTAVLQYYPLTGLPTDTAVGHFTHTDNGSITVLFVTDWGLQVYSPEHDSWEYVAPRKNFAIINIGDSIKFMSGGRLKSCPHRVVPWKGHWTAGPRYASIFFLRPNDDTLFTDSEGTRWTAKGWVNKKFSNYRSPHKEQALTSFSTGRKGFVGILEKTHQSAAVA